MAGMAFFNAISAVSLIFVAGCATPVTVATSAPACRAIKTVWISKDDVLTEGTAQQVEANNLARRRLCGKG